MFFDIGRSPVPIQSCSKCHGRFRTIAANGVATQTSFNETPMISRPALGTWTVTGRTSVCAGSNPFSFREWSLSDSSPLQRFSDLAARPFASKTPFVFLENEDCQWQSTRQRDCVFERLLAISSPLCQNPVFPRFFSNHVFLHQLNSLHYYVHRIRAGSISYSADPQLGKTWGLCACCPRS